MYPSFVFATVFCVCHCLLYLNVIHIIWGMVTKEEEEGGRVMYVSTVRRPQNGLGRQGGSTFPVPL